MLAGTILREGDVVPSVRFVDGATGGGTDLARYRQRASVVLAFLHAGCTACRAYAGAIAAAGADLEWAGAVARAVVPTDEELSLPVLVDASGAATSTLLDGEGGPPFVLVLDRYGAATAAYGASDHRFPPVEEIVATLTHLAIQCPECGVSHWPEVDER
jgi:hypothetical protein